MEEASLIEAEEKDRDCEPTVDEVAKGEPDNRNHLEEEVGQVQSLDTSEEEHQHSEPSPAKQIDDDEEGQEEMVQEQQQTENNQMWAWMFISKHAYINIVLYYIWISYTVLWSREQKQIISIIYVPKNTGGLWEGAVTMAMTDLQDRLHGFLTNTSSFLSEIWHKSNQVSRCFDLKSLSL